MDVVVAAATAAAALRSILIDKRDALLCIFVIDGFPLLLVVGGGGKETGLELFKELPLRIDDKVGIEESSSAETSLLAESEEDSTCCGWAKVLGCWSVVVDCDGSVVAPSGAVEAVCDI